MLKEKPSPGFRFGFYGTAPPVDFGGAGVLYIGAGVYCYPSIYGMTNVEDDFAEAFALYAHVKLLAKPYHVVLAGMTFDTPIFAYPCAARSDLVERALKSATPP